MMFFSNDTKGIAYLYGLIAARRTRLLTPKDYENLIQLPSVDSILNHLSAGDYVELKEVHKPLSFEEIEQAFNSHFNSILKEFNSHLSPKTRKLLSSLILSPIELENLKTLFRSLHSNLNVEERQDILDSRSPFYTIFKSLIQRVESIEELAKELYKLKLIPDLRNELKQYAQSKELLLIEARLEHDFFSKWRVELEGVEEAMFYFEVWVDIMNLLNLLRCRINDIEAEPYLLPSSGMYLTPSLITKLSEVNVENYPSLLSPTPYFRAMRESISFFQRTHSLAPVEIKLHNTLLNLIHEKAIHQPLSVYSLLDYLLHKNEEIKNLKVIIFTKTYSLPPSKIRELLGLQ